MAYVAADRTRVSFAAALLSAFARIGRGREAVRKSDVPDGGPVVVDLPPHLMRDVGFEASAGPGGRVWRSGPVRTGVSRLDVSTGLLRRAGF